MHAWINITHPGFSGRQDMPDDGDQWVSWEQMVATLRANGESRGPTPDYTGEGSAWVPPKMQPGDGFPKVVAWPTEEHGCLYDPPSLPGSSPSLAAKVQEIQAGAVMVGPVDDETAHKLELQWEAAKALEKERNELQAELDKTRAQLSDAIRAKGDAEGRAALAEREVAKLKQAPAVVVPPLPKPTGRRADDAPVWGMPQDLEDVCRQAGNPVLAAYQVGIRRGHAIAQNSVRPIPADRDQGGAAT